MRSAALSWASSFSAAFSAACPMALLVLQACRMRQQHGSTSEAKLTKAIPFVLPPCAGTKQKGLPPLRKSCCSNSIGLLWKRNHPNLPTASKVLLKLGPVVTGRSAVRCGLKSTTALQSDLTLHIPSIFPRPTHASDRPAQRHHDMPRRGLRESLDHDAEPAMRRQHSESFSLQAKVQCHLAQELPLCLLLFCLLLFSLSLLLDLLFIRGALGVFFNLSAKETAWHLPTAVAGAPVSGEGRDMKKGDA